MSFFWPHIMYELTSLSPKTSWYFLSLDSVHSSYVMQPENRTFCLSMEYEEKNDCLKYISWAQHNGGRKRRVLLDLMSNFCSEIFSHFPEPIFQIFSMEFEVDTIYYSSLLNLYFCTWICSDVIIHFSLKTVCLSLKFPVVVILSSLLLDNFFKGKGHVLHTSVFLWLN